VSSSASGPWWVLGPLLIVATLVGCSGATTPSPATSSPASSSPATSRAANPSASPPAASSSFVPLEPGTEWVVFQWILNDGDGLYLERPDGRDRHEIDLNVIGSTFHPDWSPDGNAIAFESDTGGANNISIVRVDRDDVRVLVENGAECPAECEVTFPAWSPDGHSIAFARLELRGGSLLGSGLEIVDVETGARRRAYEAPRNTALHYPRWSPDGRFLVFESTEYPTGVPDAGTGSGSWISVIEVGVAVPAARPLTKPGAWASYPDWSPSGRDIVFTTYDLGEFQGTDEASNLFLIHPDGSDLRTVTAYPKAGERATQPTWTPDGARIMFTLVGQNADFDRPRRAATIDATGANLEEIPGSATHPRSRPVRTS
jgi:Tol biopolymer transport system component